MPIVTVQLLEGRTTEQKRALAKAITEAVVEHGKVPPDSVDVLFVDMPRSDWAKAGVFYSDK